jgi:hypothetical protein
VVVAVNNQCVLLAIDPGAVSGMSLWVNGQLTYSAQVGKAHERHEVVRNAVRLQHNHHLPLMVVREAWTGGGKRMGPKTIAGMGAAWGAWREHLLLLQHPMGRVVKVTPQRWRSSVLGGPQRSTDKWKSAAQAYVSARFGNTDCGPDEAEAICIGAWGVLAPEVFEATPTRLVSLR